MSFEIKHLAPYLPYGLKCMVDDDDNNCVIMELTSLTTGSSYESADFISINSESMDTVNLVHIEDIRPILRPMSDINNFIPTEYGQVNLYRKYDLHTEDGVFCDMHYAEYGETPKAYVPVNDFNWWLFEHHFDVFGLINSGYASSIHEINI